MRVGVEELEPLRIAGGDVNGAAAVESSVAAPQNSKHKITAWRRSSTSGYTAKGTEQGLRYSQSHAHHGIPLISEKVEATHVAVSGWMRAQTCSTCAVKYYLALKRKGILIHATTQRALAETTVCEISQ